MDSIGDYCSNRGPDPRLHKYYSGLCRRLAMFFAILTDPWEREIQ